jgi:hypothetical protein
MAAAVYLICAALAFFNYPLAFSPLTNWLSDLGNPIVNPSGAFLYNLGCVLTGLCLVFFTLGLDIWKNGDHKRRTLLRIAQATGILAALSLIVSALFPLGAQTFLHSISGKAHIFFTGFFLSFSATILLRHPITPKWIAYFGFLAAVVNFIYGAILYSVFIAEWVAIGLFILYVLIISANTLTQKTIVGMKFAR